MTSVSEEKSDTPAAKKSFDVLFVGLICFRITARKAVLPDARVPGDDTLPPHTPFLVVEPKDVKSSSGWDGTNSDPVKGVYTFGPCTISIPPATVDGSLDAGDHNTNVFKLPDADGTFAFAGSGFITEINLGQGKLELLKSPSDDANVSRLHVQHDGDVTVTVTLQGGGTRVLVLEPGTDVAIANLPLSVSASQTGNWGKLFKKIAATGSFNPDKPIRIPGMPALGKSYQVFKIDLPRIGPLGGCCPPP